MENVLRNKLKKVEELSKASKLSKCLHNPYNYLNALVVREFIYRFTKRCCLKQCQTFFNEQMYVDLPAATDIYLTGGKTHDSEVRLAKFLISNVLKNDVFVDIGAHFGYYSLLVNHIGISATYSLEASPNNYTFLLKNTQDFENIHIYNKAVSFHSGEITFYEFPTNYSENNTIYARQFEAEHWYKKNKPTAVHVPAITLDAFVKSENIYPDFIKLDVEGAELDIIKGGTTFLTNHSPTLIIEHLTNNTIDMYLQVNDALKSLDYSAYIIDQNGEISLNNNMSHYLNNLNIDSDNIVYKKEV